MDRMLGDLVKEFAMATYSTYVCNKTRPIDKCIELIWLRFNHWMNHSAKTAAAQIYFQI